MNRKKGIVSIVKLSLNFIWYGQVYVVMMTHSWNNGTTDISKYCLENTWSVLNKL